MNVLVTGASGFLGQYVLQELFRSGHAVEAPSHAQCDLMQAAHVERCGRAISSKGPIDAVVHLAGIGGGLGFVNSHSADLMFSNIKIGIGAFTLAQAVGAKRIISIGSSCSYPGYLTGELAEDLYWNGALHESVEAYGFSKKFLAVAQRAYNRQYGITGGHLILNNLYGPGDHIGGERAHVVGALIEKFTTAVQNDHKEVTLWGDGSPIREFLYVRDAAKAIVRALTVDMGTDPVNICSGTGTSIRDLATLISETLGFQGAITWDTSKPNGAPKKVLSPKRMEALLHWRPQVTLAEGLQRTIAWYLSEKAPRK